MKHLIATMLFISLCLYSCSDDRTGEIVHKEVVQGKWKYDGISHDVATNLLPVTTAIIKDIKSSNKTSEYILELTNDRYIISEQTVLQDSGRYILSNGILTFTSKMHETPALEDAPIMIYNNDLTLVFDKKNYYNTKKLGEMGIENPSNVTVSKAIYYYLFYRQ